MQITLTEQQLWAIQSALFDSASYWSGLYQQALEGKITHLEASGAKAVYDQQNELYKMFFALTDNA